MSAVLQKMGDVAVYTRHGEQGGEVTARDAEAVEYGSLVELYVGPDLFPLRLEV